MEKVFIVVSHSGVIMGVFSNKETAEACKKHYSKKLPKNGFSIFTECIDLLNKEDYE